MRESAAPWFPTRGERLSYHLGLGDPEEGGMGFHRMVTGSQANLRAYQQGCMARRAKRLPESA